MTIRPTFRIHPIQQDGINFFFWYTDSCLHCAAVGYRTVKVNLENHREHMQKITLNATVPTMDPNSLLYLHFFAASMEASVAVALSMLKASAFGLSVLGGNHEL